MTSPFDVIETVEAWPVMYNLVEKNNEVRSK